MKLKKFTAGSFSSEAKLVDVFVSHLDSGLTPWNLNSVLREFDYVSGRTDVLSLSSGNEIMAFEAKLSDWRKAIHQAWRNTSFADRVFVVLPRNKAKLAEKHRSAFISRGVGLCIVDQLGIEVIIDGNSNKPIMPWLNKKAMKALSVGNNSI